MVSYNVTSTCIIILSTRLFQHWNNESILVFFTHIFGSILWKIDQMKSLQRFEYVLMAFWSITFLSVYNNLHCDLFNCVCYINIAYYKIKCNPQSPPSGHFTLKLVSKVGQYHGTTSIDLISTSLWYHNIIWTSTLEVNMMSRMCLENYHWQ